MKYGLYGIYVMKYGLNATKQKKTKKNLPSFADGWPGRRQSDQTFTDGQPSAKPFLFKIKIKKRKKVLCRRLATLAPLSTDEVAVSKALPAG
jgi:hypothetical protein